MRFVLILVIACLLSCKNSDPELQKTEKEIEELEKVVEAVKSTSIYPRIKNDSIGVKQAMRDSVYFQNKLDSLYAREKKLK